MIKYANNNSEKIKDGRIIISKEGKKGVKQASDKRFEFDLSDRITDDEPEK